MTRLVIFPAYLPPAPEEDVQQQRNRLKRGDLDNEERKRLMEETFSDRRQHAVALRTPMKKFLQMYPALKQQEEVSMVSTFPVLERR